MASILNWLEGAFAQVNPFDNGEDYGSVMRRKQREEQQRRVQQPQQPQPRPQPQQRAPFAQPQARQDFTQPQAPALQPSNTPASLSRKSVVNRPNNLRIGDFEYTQNPDGTFTNTKSGEKRTSEQIKRLQQIEGQFQERQNKINSDQAWGTVGDIVSAPVKVGLGIGKGATDLATGQVGDWGNRVADFGNAAAEVAREVTGENQRAFEQQQKTSAEYMRMANSFMQRANNARTPAEKQKYIDQARSLWSASDEVMGQAQNDINRGLEATDPKKTISNAGMTALDLATLGKGKMILEGVNLGQKVGTQSLKTLGKNTLITAAEGAGIGGTYGGLATMQDPNAELIDYAKNIGTGALLGAGAGVGAQIALPVAGVVSKKAIDSGVKGAQVAGKIANEARPSVVARQHPSVTVYDDHVNTLLQAYDNEPNQLVRHELNKAISAARQEQAATFNQVKRELTQGGYAKVPGGGIDDTLDGIVKDDLVQGEAARVAKPEAYIKELTDTIWEANKKGQGVEIAQRATDYGNGGVETFKSSNNTPFRRAYFEEYGKAPTKKEVDRLVREYMDGKDNIVRYEVDPDQRAALDLISERDEYLNRMVDEPQPIASASSSATKKVTELPEQRKSVKEPLQKQSIEVPRTTQGKTSRLAQQSDQRIPSPDSKAQIDRTYTDNTPEIDTKQYVKKMNKSQKDATKGLSGLGKKTDDFKEKFIDDLAPIEDRLKDAIDKGATVDPKDHISYQLDRSRRSEGIMHAYVRDNGLDKIIQGVPNTKEFDQYLIAKHAKELDPEVRTGRDPIKDAALVKQLDGKYGKAAKELYKYNQKLLDSSVEYGLISKSAANKLKKQYPEYVPFNRIFNEDELANLYGGSGRGDASLSSQNVVKKIKGSNRVIASPLNSIIDKTRVVVEQGERNRAAKMLADYRELPGNPFNLKEIPSGETIGSRSTISYMDKGVKRTFETDKAIADAAKNMTRQEIGMWGRIAAVPARALRGGATTVNVGFAGANVVKDVVGAAINSKHPFRITNPKAVGKALAAALKHNGKHYQELMREGVAGTSFDMYRNPLKSNVGELRSHKNLATRAAYNATHPGQWYRTMENTIGRSEDFGRALQYYSNKSGFEKKLGKNSKSAKILAADQARHNSTNFFRHGSYGKGINLAIPYWNAGVQGARIQTRRIVERPVQTLAKIGFVIGAPSAMIAMNNYANEKNRQVIEDIPQYEKDSNIIIVGPDARKNQDTGRWEGVYKIPVPPQHIGIHKTIQDAVRASVTGEPMDIMADLGRVTEDYTTVNPADPQATASRYTPQGVKLFAEPMTNTNFYTGNKIVPDSQKNLPAADQYGEYTSGTAKTIGKITNTSPRQIDNAIRTALGGAGQNAVNIIDTGLAGSGVIDKKDIRGKNLTDSITGRFYGAAAINPSDAAEKKFDQLKEQIIETDSYKNASTYDKTRMLNRLERDISDVSWYMSGKSDKDTKLTKKQSSLLIDGFNTDNYTNLDTKSASKVEINESISEKHRATLKAYYDMDADKRESWFAEKNDNEYKYYKAKYENDKANGEISDIEDVKRKRYLYKDKVGAKFSKDTRDLYSLSKADIATYLSKAKNGERVAEELLKYDRALYDAGLSKYMKFRYGFGSSSGRKGSGRGGGRATGVTEAKARVALARKLNGMKAPTTSARQEKPSVSKAEYKKTPLRKYTVTKAGKTGQPLRITTRKA